MAVPRLSNSRHLVTSSNAADSLLTSTRRAPSLGLFVFPAGSGERASVPRSQRNTQVKLFELRLELTGSDRMTGSMRRPFE
jgi:hypothetical protein